MDKKEKLEHNHKCYKCGKIATRNIQNMWIESEVSPSEEYRETNMWEGEGSYYLCDNCELE